MEKEKQSIWDWKQTSLEAPARRKCEFFFELQVYALSLRYVILPLRVNALSRWWWNITSGIVLGIPTDIKSAWATGYTRKDLKPKNTLILDEWGVALAVW